MALKKEQISEIIKMFGKDEKDTGSTPVQIALLTAQIKELTAHLKTHPKDHHSHRGLMVLIGQRKSLLAYLSSSDYAKYLEVIEKLGLRK
ncbi:MAG: 30S ribosomal protein S15 [Erysipelotrichaceae bacterium]|jgi:small subunit ribosomal protein S15|nr:30S ribosomal protein S15 [Erysipelotrichaceae bacterium]